MRSKLQENISEGGFTLLELIIVLILISILSAISTPLFKTFIRKVYSAAGKTSITNIKKECTTNKNLQVQEFFTPIETRGYSINPTSSSSCFGDVKNNLISLVPNDSENPIYTYDHMLGKINTINPSTIKKEAFLKKSYPTGVSWLSCADSYAHRYTGAYVGGSSRWTRNYAFDKDPKTIWACGRNGDIKFDLGKTQKINTINIYNPGFRYKWTGNVSDAANYVKIYVDDKLVAEGIQQAGVKDQWDIDDIEGRYITYKTFIKPHHKECLKMNGSCPLGSERNTNRYSELGEISINGEKQNKFLGDQEYDYKYIYQNDKCRTRWYQANFSFWDWKTFTPQCPLVEN